QHRVGDLGFPKLTSRSRIEGNQRGVERTDKDPVAEYSYTAIGGINLVWIACLLLPRVGPNRTAGLRVERRHCPRRRCIHNAINDKRLRLESSRVCKCGGPLRLQA